MNSDTSIFRVAERNNNGMAAEKVGKIVEAISFYEENIKENYPATHSYDRLMIIYKRSKMYTDEIRVIDNAIKVYKKENEMRYKKAISNPKNKEYLLNIQAAEKAELMIKNQEGWVIFNPYPVLKLIDRRTKTVMLQEKISHKRV